MAYIERGMLRESREVFGISRRELAEASGVSAPSIADIEEGRRKTVKPDIEHKLCAGMWRVLKDRKQGLTSEQQKLYEPHLDRMVCAYEGLTIGVAPEKLLAYFESGGELSQEEQQRHEAFVNDEAPTGAGEPIKLEPRLTFEQAG